MQGEASRHLFEGPGPDAQYKSHLANGKFMIQQCSNCHQYVFYPRALCPHCHAPELSWIEASGRGTVYSTSVIRRKPEHGGDYNIVLVDLEEGPRMMSRVEKLPPEQVKIGMHVQAKIAELDGQPAIVFIQG